MTSTAHNSFA